VPRVVLEQLELAVTHNRPLARVSLRM
jgi:hypothetical protein